MSRPMPILDAKTLTGEALFFAEEIVGRGGRIRATKPTKTSNPNILVGDAQYVWRMVAFHVSPRAPHHCMPVCADFGMRQENYPTYDDRRARTKVLDGIVDQIVDTFPKAQMHGINRWGRAFGMA